MEREFTCIVCPIGCRLHASGEAGAVLVTGNRCPRGKAYAEGELSHPVRMVTALVRLEPAAGAENRPHASPRGAAADPWGPRMLPVRTRSPFPKERIPELLSALRGMRVRPPVSSRQVILADALGTGIDVVATLMVE